MHAPSVIEVEIAPQDRAQVALVQDDDLVQAFAAQGLVQSLGTGILPWTAWRREHLLDVQTAHSPTECSAVDAVADQTSGCGIERERLDHLLRGPRGHRARGDLEIDDPAALVGEHGHDGIEALESNCRHDDEVDGDEVIHVRLEKRPPRRRWRARRADPRPLDRRLRDHGADLGQLTNDGGEPQPVFACEIWPMRARISGSMP